jgi:hypothetical protein
MFSQIVVAAVSAAVAFAEPVPVPKVTGPIPVSATSRIFGEAARNLVPTDLAAAGYLEEEYFVSGVANVYDWRADGSVTVIGANNSYTTRIVVRRPARAERFSGTVIVEIPNIARRFDWPMIWGFTRDYILESGHAWVQIGMPQSVAAMKKVDPVRYGALEFRNASQACPGETEDGLRYDMIAQVAAALRSRQTGMPLAALNPERLFLTTQDTGLITFINAFHDVLRLEGGRPAYDGYVIKVLNAPGPINSCARPLAPGDPRRMLKGVDVPSIAVIAQGEVEGVAWSRIPDSDAPSGRHRRYEFAMAAHIDKHAYAGLASFAEQAAAGNAQGTPDWPFAARCEPEIRLQEEKLMSFMFDTAFWHLERWVKDGVAPPKAPRMELDADGKMPLDAFGIGRGGIRSPYSDVPVARYLTASGGPGNCRELGSTHPLRWSELEQLYGNHAGYLQRVNAATDRMLREQWITPSDARRLRQELAQ